MEKNMYPFGTEYLDGKEIEITEPEPGRGRPWVRKARFDRKHCAIELLGENDRFLYEIGLDEAMTPERLLSWLFHIGRKNWGTPQVISAILKIVDQVIRETTGETAEHCYCYRREDSRGREKNGFDWVTLHHNHYEKENNK